MAARIEIAKKYTRAYAEAPKKGKTRTIIRQLVRTLRRYRTIDIQAGNYIITAEDPPPNIGAWLEAIHGRESGAH